MTYTKAAARKLAQSIIDQNHAGRSYRAIADCFPRQADGSQIVKAGTLNRIAKEMGEWIPKDPEILVALGLKEIRTKEKQPEWLRRRKKAIRKMMKETKQSVLKRKP